MSIAGQAVLVASSSKQPALGSLAVTSIPASGVPAAGMELAVRLGDSYGPCRCPRCSADAAGNAVSVEAESLRGVAAGLAKRGIRSRTGRGFAPVQVKRMVAA